MNPMNVVYDKKYESLSAEAKLTFFVLIDSVFKQIRENKPFFDEIGVFASLSQKQIGEMEHFYSKNTPYGHLKQLKDYGLVKTFPSKRKRYYISRKYINIRTNQDILD